MDSKILTADRNRPAFVALTTKLNGGFEGRRYVGIVARISDLDNPTFLAAGGEGFVGNGQFGGQGERPTMLRERVSKIIGGDHPNQFGVKVCSTCERYVEVYPLTDDEIEFLQPYIDAIERLYARQ